MARQLARKLPYIENQVETKSQSSIVSSGRAIWVRFIIVFLLVSAIVGVGMFQIRLHSETINYKEKVSTLEQEVNQITLENEALKKEVEKLASPSRLYQEGERLGMRPADKFLEVPKY
jgi:cell division protein FtsL